MPETHHPSHSDIAGSNDSENITLYIGDSMLKHLNNNKMSSTSQKALVLSYPGATAGSIQAKIKSDQQFLHINPNKVSKIFILCGANNVDKVLHVPFHMNSNFIQNETHQPLGHALNHAKTELMQLFDFLHNWSQSAVINFINILPRESEVRNRIINSLNSHVKTLANDTAFVKFVSTKVDRNLFTFKNGYRKNSFFSNQGEDNVHLNNLGTIRLAKHLKYMAHH